MPIKIIKSAPQSRTVLWKDVQVGDVYRSGGLLVLAANPPTGTQLPRAVALECTEAAAAKAGDVWMPGENSEWTPMRAVLTVAVQCES